MSRSSESSSQSSRISSNSNAGYGQRESFDSSELGSISPLKVLRKRSRSSKSSIDSAKNKEIIANFNNNSDDTLKTGEFHSYSDNYKPDCITCRKLKEQENIQNAQISEEDGIHEYNPDNSRSSNSRQKKKKRKKASSRSGGTKRTKKRRRNSKRKSKRRNT